jgi:hypothetical protein
MNTKWVKYLLIALFLGAAVLDIASTHFAVSQSPEIAARESNPLVAAGLGFMGMYIVKMSLMLVIVWMFTRPQKSERIFYFQITFMLLLIVAQLMAAYGNYYIGNHADEYALLQPMTEDAKANYYTNFIKVTILFPFIIAFLPYLIFEWTYKYETFSKRRLIYKGEINAEIKKNV